MPENHKDYWDEKNLDGYDENGIGYRLDKHGKKLYKPTEHWDPEPMPKEKLKWRDIIPKTGEGSNPEDDKGK